MPNNPSPKKPNKNSAMPMPPRVSDQALERLYWKEGDIQWAPRKPTKKAGKSNG